MEMNASMKETMASVSTKVRSEVQKVRSAVEMIFSVFQRIISVPNKIISVTEIIVDGGDGRHIDDHLWDGENRFADGLHSRCDGNHFHEVIEDCTRNGNHYRRGFNKPVWIGNDRGDFPFHRCFALCRCVHDALNGTPCSIRNGMSVCLFFNGLSERGLCKRSLLGDCRFWATGFINCLKKFEQLVLHCSAVEDWKPLPLRGRIPSLAIKKESCRTVR